MGSITPATEHDIMEATREQLAGEGFRELRLTAVAREADVAGELLRREYDDPAGLAAAFVDYERDRLAERLLVASDDPGVRLRELLDLVVDRRELGTEELAPAYMEMSARAADHEPLREALVAFEADLHAALAETLREGVDADVFRNHDPEAVATMVLSARETLARRRTLSGDGAAVRDALDALVLSQVRAPEQRASTTRSS
jgi:AcrR family transcriptional regulator